MNWEEIARQKHKNLLQIRGALIRAYRIQYPEWNAPAEPGDPEYRHGSTMDLLRIFLPADAFGWPAPAEPEEPEGELPPEPPRRPRKGAAPQAQTIREIAAEVAELVEEKGRSYGPALGASVAYLRALYPDGIPPEQYDFVCLLVRISDKIARLAGPNPGAFGESPWRDIIGYALRGAERSQNDH